MELWGQRKSEIVVFSRGFVSPPVTAYCVRDDVSQDCPKGMAVRILTTWLHGRGLYAVYIWSGTEAGLDVWHFLARIEERCAVRLGSN